MLCSNCSAREAGFHYKYIQNGVAREIHLCLDCAKKLGYIKEKESFFNPGSIFGEFFSNPYISPGVKEELKCPSCNTSFESIRRTGFVGCDKCYETFDKLIDTILNKIQPSNVHKGKLSGPEGKKIEHDKTAEQLKEKLSRAILDENYEEAAIIRDKIKELESKGGDK